MRQQQQSEAEEVVNHIEGVVLNSRILLMISSARCMMLHIDDA